MAGYVSKDKKTHISFLAQSYTIAEQEELIKSLQNDVGQMQDGNAIDQPEPNIPFDISNRADVDGIHPTFATKIPDTTKELHVVVIRSADNKKLSSDTDDAAAIKRAKAACKHFRFAVNETDAAAGSTENETDKPLKPRKNSSDQSFQLLRLVCLDNAGAFAQNPDDSPFNVSGPFNPGDQIFPSLVVRDKYDAFDSGHTAGDAISVDADKRYFNIGNSVSDPPSKPDLTLIVCNRAEMTTQAHKAEVEVKVFASDVDHSKTFAEMMVDHCQVKFQRTNDPANPTNVSFNDHTFGGLVDDLTQTFVVIKCSLFVGAQYSWTKCITSNASDRRVSTPSSPVLFYAGGNNDLANLAVIPGLTPGTNVPGQSDNAKLQCIATAQNVHHTTVLVKLQQPGTVAVACDPTTQGVIFRRIEVYEQLPGDPVPTEPIKSRTVLHKKKDFAAGQLITEKFKVPHKARQTGIKYWAVLVGVGDPEQTLTTFPTTVNSTNAVTVPDPVLADIVENIPDGDMSRHRARTTFKLWTTTDARNGSGTNKDVTWRQLLVDHVHVWLRRLKDFTAQQIGSTFISVDPAAADEATTHHSKHGGPIPDADLDTTSTLVTVHEKHLGAKWRWEKNVYGQHGVPSQSVGTNPAPGFVDFVAGYGMGGAFDPSLLQNLNIQINRINKRHSEVIVMFDQPAPNPVGNPPVATPAVLLKSVELFKNVPTRTKSGTGTISANGLTVTGVGTMFTKELTVGSIINANGLARNVIAIASDTSLTVLTSMNTAGAKAFTYSTPKEVKHRSVKNKPAYSSNTSAGDLAPPNTATHKEVPFEVHHPPNLVGIQYFALIRAVGNDFICCKFQDTTSPIPYAAKNTRLPDPTIDVDTGTDKPTVMPSVPAYADIVANAPQGEMGHGHARVTFRVYAEWNRTQTFRQVNADSAYVILVDPGDPMSGAGSERYKEGGPVTDLDATFVDITVKVLTTGKAYIWRRNVTALEGGQQPSTKVDVMFVAGGGAGSPNLPELSSVSLTLSKVFGSNGKADSRHADCTLQFTQGPSGTVSTTNGSATVNGTGTLFLTECPAGSYITVNGVTGQVNGTPASNTQLTLMAPFTATNVNASYTSSQVPVFLKRVEFERSINGGAFKDFKIRHLFHKLNYQQAGLKTIVVPVHHPKNTPVAVRATIYAMSGIAGQDGNNRLVTQAVAYTSQDEKEFSDDGAPIGAASAKTKARWHNNHLRIRFDLPVGAGNNMNTHSTNKVLLVFGTGGNQYLWDPVGLTTLLTAAPINPLANTALGIAQAGYLQDIGKTSHHSYNNSIPGSGGEAKKNIDTMNTTVYDSIFSSGGILTIYAYSFNDFNDVQTGAQVAAASFNIPTGWPTPQDYGN